VTSSYGSTRQLVSDKDDRIDRFSRVPLAGKPVLELGPLEGGHTKQVVDLGASDVLATEANPPNFVKKSLPSCTSGRT